MTVDELLEAAGDVQDPDPAVLQRHATRVAAELDASIARIRRAAVRRSRRRRFGIAIAASAACAVALVVTQDDDQSRPAAEPSPASSPAVKQDPDFVTASAVLRSAAGVGTPAEARPDQYWRVDSVTGGDGQTTMRTLWTRRNAPSQLVDERVAPGRLITIANSGFPLQGQTIDWDGLFALPTDVDALLAVLRGGVEGPTERGDHIAFKTVYELLSESPAPRAVRAALWRAASELEGVSLLGRTTDSQGRPGWAMTDGDTTYVVDPSSGRFLESRADDGSWHTTILDQGPTNIAPSVDPAPLPH